MQKKRRVINKEGYVLDIRKHRGKKQAVKIWAAFIFARHIERNRKVIFISTESLLMKFVHDIMVCGILNMQGSQKTEMTSKKRRRRKKKYRKEGHAHYHQQGDYQL